MNRRRHCMGVSPKSISVGALKAAAWSSPMPEPVRILLPFRPGKWTSLRAITIGAMLPAARPSARRKQSKIELRLPPRVRGRKLYVRMAPALVEIAALVVHTTPRQSNPPARKLRSSSSCTSILPLVGNVFAVPHERSVIPYPELGPDLVFAPGRTPACGRETCAGSRPSNKSERTRVVSERFILPVTMSGRSGGLCLALPLPIPISFRLQPV